MKPMWSGLRAIREKVPPSRGAAEMKFDAMEEKIRDLRRTLAGDSTAKRWQQIKTELTNEESSLRSLLETRNHNCLAGDERYSSLVELRKERM